MYMVGRSNIYKATNDRPTILKNLYLSMKLVFEKVLAVRKKRMIDLVLGTYSNDRRTLTHKSWSVGRWSLYKYTQPTDHDQL